MVTLSYYEKVTNVIDGFSGTWDNEIPTCQSANCAANQMPPIPPNSYTLTEIGVTFEVGAVVSFKCRNGYISSGDNYTECLPNGKWLVLNMICSRKFNYLGPVYI